MKIVYKKTKILQIAAIGVCLLSASLATSSFAADQGGLPANTLPPLATPPALNLPSAAGSTDNTAMAGAPADPFALPKAAKPLESIEVKVPDSVKDVVKRLSAADTITLEDLNSARQAVAKIDALIEIQKKLAELEKLRNDQSNKPLANAIPASAINALPITQLPVQRMGPPKNAGLPHDLGMDGLGGTEHKAEVSRIIGTGGRYAAVIKNGDQTNIIKVGDHFDGGTVLSISQTGLQVEQGKTTHTVQVKNVANVFGDSR